MSSLIQALSNRSPIIWVNTLEPERVISAIPTLKNDTRPLYVYDDFSGLMIWDTDSTSWKIVLIQFQDEDGNLQEVPIKGYNASFSYILSQDPNVFLIRNAHKSIDDYLTLYSVLFGRFRETFLEDDLDKLPTQIISFAANEPPPSEIASMATVVSWGLPTVQELTNIITSIRTNYKTDVAPEETIPELVKFSLGLTEHDAMQTYLSSIRSKGIIDKDVLKHLRLERMKQMSNLEIDEPKVQLSDVGGLDNAKKLIQKAVWISEHPEQAAEYNIAPLRRFLLLGLSGCGKSYLCEAAASALGLQLAKAGVSKAMNKFIGQSEANISSMFDQINAMAPIAVWIDELGRDLSGGGSSEYTDGGTTSRVHGLFLTKMQELNKDVFLFAAANNIESLAPEMLRADRFDKLLFVGFPSYQERIDIFGLHLPKGEEYNLEELAANTPCFTGAEIKSLIQRTIFDVSPTHNRLINTSDLLEVIPHQKNRIWIRHRALAVSMYQSAYNDYEWASSSQFAEAQIIMNGSEPRQKAMATANPIVFK